MEVEPHLDAPPTTAKVALEQEGVVIWVDWDGEECVDDSSFLSRAESLTQENAGEIGFTDARESVASDPENPFNWSKKRKVSSSSSQETSP